MRDRIILALICMVVFLLGMNILMFDRVDALRNKCDVTQEQCDSVQNMIEYMME